VNTDVWYALRGAFGAVVTQLMIATVIICDKRIV